MGFMSLRGREERGAVAVFVAITLPALLGMGAFVVDMGLVWQTRRHLQNCADAAALAAAAELGNQIAANGVALDYAFSTGPTGCLDVVNDPLPAIRFIDRNADTVADTIEVVTQRQVGFGFARIFGSLFGDVRARAVAGKVSPGEWLYMEPFALQVDPNQECGRADVTSYSVDRRPLRYGESFTIKYGAGGSDSPGNFQALALGGRGASDYGENFEFGYEGWVASCSTVTTEPGNKVGDTLNALEARRARYALNPDSCLEALSSGTPPVVGTRWYNCPLVINIAIVPPLSGGRSEAPVLTFGWFLIEDFERDGPQKALITGKFLNVEDKKAPPNEWKSTTPWDPNSSLPWGVRLLE